uniref:Beta-amylase n=1 Tax=Thraustotheca clavata TaxID=74557 RepID=A0A0A7CMD8_9STRA|nr:secreted protein [Thraustotheca clavata]
MFGQLLLMVLAVVLPSTTGVVPVNVMLALDTVVSDGKGGTALKNSVTLNSQFQKLKANGATGVMSDCWWGLVESAGPRQYSFKAYQDMAQLAKNNGLTIQMVMSFHQCGGNVGDACDIPIPKKWFTRNDVWYTTKSGLTDSEYISLWADNTPLDKLGRTPLDMYREFLQAFKTNVVDNYPGTISEVQIGAGPAGELRYPSYQLQDNRWSYCGVGEFTSYDAFAAKDIQNYANTTNNALWGTSPGPSNAGNFNCQPGVSGSCPFFEDNGFDNYASNYGKFFLNWYSTSLLNHGRALSKIGRTVFASPFTLSLKVSGVHWWYNSNHHGAELTAGYYNTNNNNAYAQIATMLKENDIRFCFTCMEMTDANDQCRSKASSLVNQALDAVAQISGLKNSFAGENALPMSNDAQVATVVSHMKGAATFTFLRLTDSFDWGYFAWIVTSLKQA